MLPCLKNQVNTAENDSGIEGIRDLFAAGSFSARRDHARNLEDRNTYISAFNSESFVFCFYM